ncbi:MAG: ABC transporter ATP-binding protein [Deltaproteobacteria bacterium]|nr:ABC transporter ATP-binding protein [Deltaproteobacteria bacterium]
MAARRNNKQASKIKVTYAIRLQDVSRRLGEFWALAHINLEIKTGTTLLLTGDNGAGKTTLLKVIATLLKPNFGNLELFGTKVDHNLQQFRHRIELISHASFLYEAHTGRESLSFIANIRGQFDNKQIDELLKQVSLIKYADRLIMTYSAGMRRRLLIARLLLKQPEIALLDEPWSQLDSNAIELMDITIKKLLQTNTTVVLATHDIEHAKNLCQQRVTMAHGKIIEQTK